MATAQAKQLYMVNSSRCFGLSTVQLLSRSEKSHFPHPSRSPPEGERALVKIVNDLRSNMDMKKLHITVNSILLLCRLNAAFDTVDQRSLIGGPWSGSEPDAVLPGPITDI